MILHSAQFYKSKSVYCKVKTTTIILYDSKYYLIDNVYGYTDQHYYIISDKLYIVVVLDNVIKARVSSNKSLTRWHVPWSLFRMIDNVDDIDYYLRHQQNSFMNQEKIFPELHWCITEPDWSPPIHKLELPLKIDVSKFIQFATYL